MEARSGWNPKTLVVLMGISAFFVLSLVSVPAEAVSLAWDANTEADLAGYKVHIGISPGTFTQAVNVGRVTTFTVPDLAPGASYYFAVTAYDIFANESGFSNQVSTTIPSTITTSTEPSTSTTTTTTTTTSTSPSPTTTIADTCSSPLWQRWLGRWKKLFTRKRGGNIESCTR